MFHKTSKMSLHGPVGLSKDVFMFYETGPCVQRKQIREVHVICGGISQVAES